MVKRSQSNSSTKRTRYTQITDIGPECIHPLKKIPHNLPLPRYSKTICKKHNNRYSDDHKEQETADETASNTTEYSENKDSSRVSEEQYLNENKSRIYLMDELTEEFEPNFASPCRKMSKTDSSGAFMSTS